MTTFFLNSAYFEVSSLGLGNFEVSVSKFLTRSWSRSRRSRCWLHHCLHHKENAPWKYALHSHLLYFEIFFMWSCIRVCHKGVAYFLSSVTAFSELTHKCRYHCELHTTESVMDLNSQQLRLRFSHFSLSSLNRTHFWNLLSELFFTLRLSEILFLLWSAWYLFCEHFPQISKNLRTINDQINISGEKPSRLDIFAKLFQTMRTKPAS